MSKVETAVQKDISEVQQQGDKLETKLRDVEANLSNTICTMLHAVDYFNSQRNKRDDLEKALEVIHDDVEVVRNTIQNVVFELNLTQSQVANLETNLASVKCKVVNEAASNKNIISGLQKDVMEAKEEVEALRGNASQGENDDDGDMLCTAPSRLTSFTGRKSALEWLETNVVSESPENGQGTSCCIKTICGLGGCGKTSLAVEFTWSYKTRFPGGVFWINGESDENIQKSVVEILALVNIAASTTENIDDTLNSFLAWLSKKKHPWLLVVDNADELQDSTCPTGIKKICRGPWQRNVNALKHGHILLTTRQNAKDTRTFLKLSGEECLELQCFSEEEGALLLTQKVGLKGESLDPEAILLTKELGALPLVLEQAAAFISASPIPLSFKDYLDEYQAVKVRLLKQQPVAAHSMEAQHRLSVHTTWKMNFAYVEKKSPAAASLMRIAAFLESENIPIDVINPGSPDLDHKELRECARSKIDIAVLLKVLSSYSLFSVDRQTRVFSVHKLVQEVVRDSLTVSQRIEAMVAATRVLYSALVTSIGPSSKLTKEQHLAKNLSEFKEKERMNLIALVLNFHKLKNHIEYEINSSKGNLACTFYDETFNLCRLVSDLIRGNVFWKRLKAELNGFQLKIARMPCDPNSILLLKMMLNTSISLRNCSGNEKYEEAKKLAQETVQKLAEMENSGIFIEDDTKYRILEHMASYYALEGQWEKNYKALLELEGLSLSDENIVDLQICIARAENYVSASNFQCVLMRYVKALELARRIYRSDHFELLRVLQFITVHFENEGKLGEARQYAEEMLQIAKKQPPATVPYITGITSALSVICHFDPHSAEDTLLGILEDRWPLVYKSIRSGVFDGHIDTNDESSYAYAAMILQGLMKCFRVMSSNSSTQQKKRKLKEQKGNFYRSIAEMLVSLWKKVYVESHPEVQKAYDYLVEVLKFLGNHEEAYKLEEKKRQCNEKRVSNQCFGKAYGEPRIIVVRKLKDVGNDFFKSVKFSSALEFYTKALNQCPNDAKLLANRAAAYVKLSEQHAQSRAADEQRKTLEYALQDSNNAITADPKWVKGYYWRAVCLAKLGQTGPSLAAAAVAKHMFPSQCAQIPAVVEKFGCYNARVVTTVEDLHHATERTENNLVILVNEGKYDLPKPLKPPTNAVIVGLDKVQITCTKGVPLQMDKTVYIENITLSPTMESITNMKVKAKECLNRGELSTALSLYSKALTTCPNNPQLLTTRAITYLKSAEQKKDILSERKALLELALKDCEAAIKADPSWLLGYSTKAASLAELDRKNQAMVAAAVFKHLSSGRDSAAVSRRYGGLQTHVVESSDELRCVLQGITELEGVNQVVLIKEGEYVVEKSVQIKPPIVVAGLGKVTVSCNTGPPFHFTQEHFVENVELCGDWDNQSELQESASLDDDHDQPEVIFSWPHLQGQQSTASAR